MSFWDHLSPSAQRQLTTLATEKRFASGRVLLRRGDPSGEVFLLQQGRLEVVDATARPVVVLASLDPGDVVGEMGFVDGEVASADVRTRGSARCLVWSRASLRNALDDDPALAASVWEAVARERVIRARSATRTALHLGLGGRDAEHPDVASVLQEFREALVGLSPDLAGQQRLAQAMGRIDRKLDLVDDPMTRARVGAAARAAVADDLGRAGLPQALEQSPSAQVAPSAFRHLLDGVPAGDGRLGTALDSALLALPTAQALRRRHAAGVAAIANTSRRWLRLSLDGGAGAPAAREATASAQGDLVDESDPGAILAYLSAPPPPGVTGLLVESVLDALPERFARVLLSRLASALAPGDPVVLAGLAPTPDSHAWSGLLGWPTLRWTLPALRTLAASAGLVDLGTLQQAGGVVVVRARVARP